MTTWPPIRWAVALPRGFTLVELLIASALAVILMVALMSVTAMVKQQSDRMASSRSLMPYGPLIELLEYDLSHARLMRLKNDKLYLRGYGGLHPDSAAPMHRPVEVVYEIGHTDHHAWLLRRQSELGDAKPSQAHRALAGEGVREIEIFLVGDVTPSPEVEDAPPSKTSSRGAATRPTLKEKEQKKPRPVKDDTAKPDNPQEPVLLTDDLGWVQPTPTLRVVIYSTDADAPPWVSSLSLPHLAISEPQASPAAAPDAEEGT